MEKNMMKAIVFFSKTCSLFRKHHLSHFHTHIYIYSLPATHTHTHRWSSACLRKAECETEVHVCYYFIIRSASVFRSHTLADAGTHSCVLSFCLRAPLTGGAINTSQRQLRIYVRGFVCVSAFNQLRFVRTLQSWCVQVM